MFLSAKPSGGEGGDGLEEGQCAIGGVEAVAADAASLLVGEVEDVEGGMEAEVAWAEEIFQLDDGRVVRGDLASGFVEYELPDLVGAVAGDVGNKGVAVGRVGLHGVGAGGSVKGDDRRAAQRAVVSDGVHGDASALVVGRQHEPATPVRVDVDGPGVEGHRARSREAAAGLFDAEAGELGVLAAAGVEVIAVGADGEGEGAAVDGNVLAVGETAAVGVDGEDRDLVVLVNCDVHIPGHISLLKRSVSR